MAQDSYQLQACKYDSPAGLGTDELQITRRSWTAAITAAATDEITALVNPLDNPLVSPPCVCVTFITTRKYYRFISSHHCAGVICLLVAAQHCQNFVYFGHISPALSTQQDDRSARSGLSDRLHFVQGGASCQTQRNTLHAAGILAK